MTPNGDNEGHPETLLPWHVNGTLEGEEKTLVLSHLETCTRCRGEVEFLQELRESTRVVGSKAHPGDLEIRRFMGRLDAEQTVSTAIMQAASTQAPARRWLPLALAASLVMVAIQGALLLGGGGSEDGFAPLSGPTQGHLQVRFAPDATEGEIRELLQSNDLTIVAGPGAGGVYRLRARTHEAGTDAGEQDIMRVMELLDSRPDVVTFVAPE